MRKAVVLATMLAALCVHAQEIDKLRKELLDTETALEKSRYELLNCSNAMAHSDVGDFTRAQAKRIGLAGVTVTEVEASDGPPPLRFLHYTVAARGDFYNVIALVHRIAFLQEVGRVLDYDTLRLRATSDGVALDARVAVACWDSDAKLLTVNATPTGANADEMMLSMYRDRLQRLRTAQESIAKTKGDFRPLRLTNGLELLEEAWGDRAVKVSDVQWSRGMLTIHGIAAGTAGREAVRTALDTNGFSSTAISWSPEGSCRTFTATTPRPVKDRKDDDRLVVPANIFDTVACESAPAAKATRVAAHGTGKLSIRLHNADATSLFYILNDMNPEDGFVVDSDVDGRVDVDLVDVTPDEALAAIRTAGVAYATGGSIHHVCKSECSAAMPSKTYKGEGIALSLTEAETSDVLRVMTQLIGPEAPAVPKDVQGTVSIYVHDAPWDEIFDIVATTQRNGPPRTAAAAPRFSDMVAAHYAIEDVELAGVARDPGIAKAYGYLPGRKQIIVLDAGLTFQDGQIYHFDGTKLYVRKKDGQQVALTP